MTSKLLHEYAVSTVGNALMFEWRKEVTTAQVRERAEALIASAEVHDIPIETLLAWIHAPAPADKEWSLTEWRAWCAKFLELKQGETSL
jgi:hypothetical protein